MIYVTRDRIVCGIRNDGIQQKLLVEGNLTFDRAVQLANAIERAEMNLKEMQKYIQSHNTHKVQPHFHKILNPHEVQRIINVPGAGSRITTRILVDLKMRNASNAKNGGIYQACV